LEGLSGQAPTAHVLFGIRSTLTDLKSYGVKITTDMVDKLDALYNIDPTVQTNHTLQEQYIEHAQDLAIELVQEPINEAMSGTLWLFPTAVSATSFT
jgi:hypothetical protein